MRKPKLDSFQTPRVPHPEDVSMPEMARPIQRNKRDNKSQTKPNGKTEPMNGKTERPNRTVNNPTTEQSVLDEMSQGVQEPHKRPTERYSFEIYTDQKQKIRDLQYQYEKRTKKRLSSSRIIREAIEAYLDKALES